MTGKPKESSEIKPAPYKGNTVRSGNPPCWRVRLPFDVETGSWTRQQGSKVLRQLEDRYCCLGCHF